MSGVEHPGIIEGFNAQLSVAPDDGVGAVAFTNEARNAVVWPHAETGKLLGELIGAPPDGIRADVAQHPEIWGDICGWYTPRAQRSDMQARGMAGAGVHIVVRRGQLILRSLSPLPGLFRGLVLHPDDEHDPYVFRVTCPPTTWAPPGLCSAVRPGPRASTPMWSRSSWGSESPQ